MTIGVNFMSSKDNDEERVMQSKSDNIEMIIMINDKADEVIKELFQSLLFRCQTGLETSRKGSEFAFDCVHSLYGKCQEIIVGKTSAPKNLLQPPKNINI